MALQHPFTCLSVKAQKRAFPVMLVLTLGVMTTLGVLGKPLMTPAAPCGILCFEFAGDLPNAQTMVASWGPRGQVYAGLNLGLDYLFLVAYSSCIGLGCVLVASALDPKARFFAALGVVLAWLLFGAAVLDGIENYALIRVLLGAEDAGLPALAWWCAASKFLIVIAGMLFAAVGSVMLVAAKFRPGREQPSQ